MKKRAIPSALLLPFLIFMIAAIPIGADTSKDYRTTPVKLSAGEVLAPELLKGENYQIDDAIINDGLVNTYQLTTDYGPLTVESTAELMVRINELRAMVIMEEMDRKKVFGEALVEGAKAPVKGAAKLVTSPVETTKDIVKGTGRFISNVGDSLFSDDPDQDNALKVALGYDVAKRQFAFEFGIDPYTDYDPVVVRLGEIARAAVAGGLAPKAAMAAVDHDVVLAMQISGTAYGMMQLVRDNPPGKLQEINRQKLTQMGIEETLIEAFLNNYRYNPQEETLLVGALERIKGVNGLDIFLSNANLATEETIALSYRTRAQMMAGYHVKVAPIQSILNIGGVMTLRRKDGPLVIVAPADYVFWTRKLAQQVNAYENNLAKVENVSAKEIWVTGRFDAQAAEKLKARDWQTKENAHKVLFAD